MVVFTTCFVYIPSHGIAHRSKRTISLFLEQYSLPTGSVPNHNANIIKGISRRMLTNTVRVTKKSHPDAERRCVYKLLHERQSECVLERRRPSPTLANSVLVMR